MITVIAEKPSVAKDIASVIGANKKKNGYYEGNGYFVTWAYGHLVALALPEDYGYKSINIENLPILPKPFKLTPRKKKLAKGYKDDPTAIKQLGIINELFRSSKSLIVATDAGREGELIFRRIYKYLHCRKPFQRLWISSLTEKAIREGFSNLKDGRKYDSLYYAAEARSKADWLVGINASQALLISSGSYNNSLGRVQTPTLAMICSRYLRNRSHKPQPYWQLLIRIGKGNDVFDLTSIEDIVIKQVADNLYKKVKQEKQVVIKQINVKQLYEDSPLLYDLTTLQKDCNIKFSFSAEKTLSIAQRLYECKLITYPRTSSRYIPDDVFDTVMDILKGMKTNPLCEIFKNSIPSGKLNKRSVNSKKITDHHAMIPTGILPQNLNEEEIKVYLRIAGRFIEAFSEHCTKNSTEILVDCNKIRFSKKIIQIIEKGWKQVFDEKDDEIEDNIKIPEIHEGDTLDILNHNLIQKTTKPKPLYTEATLLTAMEMAGKDIEDEELRSAIKGHGIGTPATRAAIIETLFHREYIERHNKNLIPTKKGLLIYAAIKTMRIADVEMTAGWEKAITEIERTPSSRVGFIKAMEIFARQTVDEISSIPISIETNKEAIHICPKCKLGKVSYYAKVAKCNYTKCNLTIFRQRNGVNLSDKLLSELLKTGSTSIIKGFKGKGDSTFEARLCFDENFNLKFNFKKDKKRNGRKNRK